jgi:hypothetical protein
VKNHKWVYFIGNFQEGKCKIGCSSNPSKRLKQIQTSSPFKVSLLKTVPGDFAEEKKWHKLFEWCKESGEWYNLVPEILEFINR